MITLYMTPGSCTTGINILLEELELVFQVQVVDLMKGDTRTPEYLAINPKGTIPTLVLDDGTALTDYLTICWWLGKTYPRKQLIPEDLMAQIRVLDALNYSVNTLHGHGYTRIFTPDRYAADTSGQERVKAEGMVLVKKGLHYLNNLLAESPSAYVTEKFSIADTALFYNEFWAVHQQIALPEHCQKHFDAMLKRRAVAQVLTEEGYGKYVR